MKRVLGSVVLFLIMMSVFGQDKSRPKQPDIPGDIMIDFGWNFLLEDPNVINQKWWPSNSLGIYYMYTKKLNDYVTFNPALGFTFDKHSFKNQSNFVLDENRSFVWDTISDINLTKNKLGMTHVELPLELRYFPQKTKNGEGWFIGVGAVIGGRLGANTKIKYVYNKNSRKEKSTGDFGLSDFRYGVVARFGFKGVNLYAKYYLNDIWIKQPAGANPSLFTAGINLTGF